MHSHSSQHQDDSQSDALLTKKLDDINGFISSELIFAANMAEIKTSLESIKTLYEKLGNKNDSITCELETFLAYLEILSCSAFADLNQYIEYGAYTDKNGTNKSKPFGKLKNKTTEGINTFLEALNSRDANIWSKIFFDSIIQNIKISVQISAMRGLLLNRSNDSVYKQLITAYPENLEEIDKNFKISIKFPAISERIPRLPLLFFDFAPKPQLFYIKSYDPKTFSDFVRNHLLVTNIEAYIIGESKVFYVALDDKGQVDIQEIEVEKNEIHELKNELNRAFAENTSWKIPAGRNFISVINGGLNLAQLKTIKNWLDKKEISIKFISPFFSTERSLMRKLKRMFDFITPFQLGIEQNQIQINGNILENLSRILQESLDQTITKNQPGRPNSDLSNLPAPLETQADLQGLIDKLEQLAKYLNIDLNKSILKKRINAQLRKIKEYSFSNENSKELKQYTHDLFCASSAAIKIAYDNDNLEDSLYQLEKMNDLLEHTNDLLLCKPADSIKKIEVLNNIIFSIDTDKRNILFTTPQELGRVDIKTAVCGILMMFAGIALLALPFILAYCTGGLSLLLSIITTKVGIGLLAGGFTLLMGGSLIATSASTFFRPKSSLLDSIQSIHGARGGVTLHK